MHFGVAQRFAALIAGVRQMSLKLSAKAAAGLPRSVRGYAGLWRGIASQGQGDTDLWRGIASQCPGYAGLQRGIASQCQGVCRLVARDVLGTWGGFVLCTARRR